MRPTLIDLFCGAGGATRGYQRAGFYVVGVDIAEQPNYCGDEFVQTDALTYLLDGADAVHASPPCQAFTSMRHFGKGAGVGALDLVKPTRTLLRASGVPYVIENVMGSPLFHPIRLCGSSFGLNVWRHRLFETSFPLMAAPCAHHVSPEPIAVYGDHPQGSKERGAYRVRRARTLEEGQAAMGIDWMPWKQLTQAIPPAMTEHIGAYLLAEVERRAEVAA